MENRSHIEELESRIKRFSNSSPIEIIETLLNSISSNFNNEIALTSKNLQTSLLFLGIHASILTIAEPFFDLKKEEAYKTFLQVFLDEEPDDRKFSIISSEIHNWRNILAHQWLGISGHKIGYDYEMLKGWENRARVLFINPQIYCDLYLKAFSSSGKIWQYKKLFSDQELEEIKQRLLAKFLKK